MDIMAIVHKETLARVEGVRVVSIWRTRRIRTSSWKAVANAESEATRQRFTSSVRVAYNRLISAKSRQFSPLFHLLYQKPIHIRLLWLFLLVRVPPSTPVVD